MKYLMTTTPFILVQVPKYVMKFIVLSLMKYCSDSHLKERYLMEVILISVCYAAILININV